MRLVAYPHWSFPHRTTPFIMKQLRVLIADDQDLMRYSIVELLCKRFPLSELSAMAMSSFELPPACSRMSL